MTYSWGLIHIIILCGTVSFLCFSLAFRLYQTKKTILFSVKIILYAALGMSGFSLSFFFTQDLEAFLLFLPISLISVVILFFQTRQPYTHCAKKLFFGVTPDQLKTVVWNLAQQFSLTFNESDESYWLSRKDQMIRFVKPRKLGITSSGLFYSAWPDELRQAIEQEVTEKLTALPNPSYRLQVGLLSVFALCFLLIPLFTKLLTSFLVNLLIPAKP